MKIKIFMKIWTFTFKTRVKVTLSMKTWNDPTVITDTLPQAVSHQTPIENQFLAKVFKVLFSEVWDSNLKQYLTIWTGFGGKFNDNWIRNGSSESQDPFGGVGGVPRPCYESYIFPIFQLNIYEGKSKVPTFVKNPTFTMVSRENVWGIMFVMTVGSFQVFIKRVTLTRVLHVKATIYVKTWNDPTVITDTLPQAVAQQIMMKVQSLAKVLKAIFPKVWGSVFGLYSTI